MNWPINPLISMQNHPMLPAHIYPPQPQVYVPVGSIKVGVYKNRRHEHPVHVVPFVPVYPWRAPLPMGNFRGGHHNQQPTGVPIQRYPDNLIKEDVVFVCNQPQPPTDKANECNGASRLSVFQLAVLSKRFTRSSHVSSMECETLGQNLGLEKEQVYSWFHTERDVSPDDTFDLDYSPCWKVKDFNKTKNFLKLELETNVKSCENIFRKKQLPTPVQSLPYNMIDQKLSSNRPSLSNRKVKQSTNKRFAFTVFQHAVLTQKFSEDKYLSTPESRIISQNLGLERQQVCYWFGSKRNGKNTRDDTVDLDYSQCWKVRGFNKTQEFSRLEVETYRLKNEVN